MTTIDLRESWRVDLSAWAQRTDAVAELWLFGSRAKGTSGSDSDVDIALALMPPRGDHDWALGDYFALHGRWRTDLEGIVGRHVSLEGIIAGTREDTQVRSNGVLLWQRSDPPGDPPVFEFRHSEQ